PLPLPAAPTPETHTLSLHDALPIFTVTASVPPSVPPDRARLGAATAAPLANTSPPPLTASAPTEVRVLPAANVAVPPVAAVPPVTGKVPATAAVPPTKWIPPPAGNE